MFEIIVRAVIHDSKGNFLLVKRAKKPKKGKWSLVGGRVEKGEKAEDAIIREVKEELNINFINPTFFVYSEYFEPNLHSLVLHFAGKYKGKIKIKPDEVLEFDFFPLSNIKKKKNIAWNHKAIILDYHKSL